MLNLFILTTAVIRPDIHKKGIYNFINLINNSNLIKSKYNKIYFIINLDIIENHKKDKDDNIKLLKKNINNIININIFENNTPCFSKAFENVFYECNKIIKKEDNNIFMWLEDDWFISEENFKKYLENEIIKFNDNNYQFLMALNWKPSGPPFFFKSLFFEKVIYYINNKHKLDTNKYDPEIILQNIYSKIENEEEEENYKRKQIGIRKKKNLNNENNKNNLNNENNENNENNKYPVLFEDSGKNWAKNNNMIKWDKNRIKTEKSHNRLLYKNIK